MTTKDTAKKLRRMGAAVFATCTAALAPLGVWADTWTDASENVWTYSIANDVATVSAVSFETTNLTIPELLGGKPVTGFTAATFKGKERAVRVTIPDTVSSIPAEAFLGCVNLKAITIQGEGLKSIGATAFKGCKNLETFVMPNSVTSLGQGVFSGCTAMTAVTLGNGLTELPGVTYANNTYGCYGDTDSSTTLYNAADNGLFYNCTSLTDINWGANIGTIGNIAFLNCSALKSITIPDTVTVIGFHAFLGCSSLQTVKLGAKVTTIGRMAFRALPNLTKVTFGAKVREIQQQAFQDCVNLQNFTLPATIQYLRYRCFAGCNKALTAVTIPTNKDELTTELEQGIFSGCSKLQMVTFGDTVKELTGVTYANNTYGCYGDTDSSTTLYNAADNGLFYNCTSLKTINWGNGIKSIGNISFLNCSALESVTIPDTVTVIGRHAFLGCSSLQTVKIGNGVTKIWRMAFRALPNLTKVTFGSKVNDIDQQAFQDCVNLQNFTLPNTIQYLRYRCFAGCNKALTAVTIPTNKDELTTELEQGVFSGCTKLATVTFGDTVKTLTGVTYANNTYGCYGDTDSSTTLYNAADNALFYNCTSLKTINWGAGITTIGNVAFLKCSALESVTIPDTVTSIGYHAFLGCDNLTTVKIGNGVTTIGRMAFRALPNLTKVTFGAKVKEIQQQAFQDCVNLKNFALPDTMQYFRYRCFAGCNKALTEVTIPTNKDNETTELEQGVFSGCTKLATVTFGDTVKTLTGVTYANNTYGCYGDANSSTAIYNAADNGLFYNCTSLKTINWGNGIKKIGNVAFLNCTSLTEVTLPANIANIGNHAFYGCSALKKATVKGSVDSLGRRAFANCPALVYVWFQGPVMTFEPGYQPFAFDSSFSCVYAAPGATGYKGIAEVSGLPDDGMWCGVPIKYGAPPTYTINFSRNDSNAPLTASRTFDYGIADHLPSLSSLGWARRGFNFKGWAVSQANAAAGKVWKADWASVTTAVAAGKSLDVYAVWEIAADSYAIRFIRNDGAGTWRTVGFKHGVKTRMPSISNGLGWARRGYDFKGWALTTADAAAGKTWKGDWAYVSEPTAKGKTLEVYAVWTLKAGYYQIRFNKNDGTGKWRTLGFQLDTSTKLSTIAAFGWTRDGYTFVGWGSSKANADAGRVWKADGEWIKNAIAEGKTLSIYAIWKANGKGAAQSAYRDLRAQAACRAQTESGFAEDEGVAFYSGVLADGAGTYWLLVGTVADGTGARLGCFCAERGDVTTVEDCGVIEADGGLLLEFEDGSAVFVSPNGEASALEQ